MDISFYHGNLKCAHEYIMDIDADAFSASLMQKFISRGEILSEQTKCFREDNGNECGMCLSSFRLREILHIVAIALFFVIYII